MAESAKGCRLHVRGMVTLGKVVNKQTLFLFYILAEANKEGVIHLTTRLRSSIFKKIGSNSKNSSASITQYLTMYCKADILTSMGGGDYLVNPEVSTKHKNYEKVLDSDAKDYLQFKSSKAAGIAERRAKYEE